MVLAGAAGKSMRPTVEDMLNQYDRNRSIEKRISKEVLENSMGKLGFRIPDNEKYPHWRAYSFRSNEFEIWSYVCPGCKSVTGHIPRIVVQGDNRDREPSVRFDHMTRTCCECKKVSKLTESRECDSCRRPTYMADDGKGSYLWNDYQICIRCDQVVNKGARGLFG